MKKILIALVVVLGTLFVVFHNRIQDAAASVVHPRLMVLVHGYLSDASTWDVNGVNAALASRGWRIAGVVVPGPNGMILPPGTAADKTVLAVTLPSTAPLAVQADVLHQALQAIEKASPRASITLVGHSAGGVVARMELVRSGAGQVVRLITIASPNAGTSRALQAIDETHTHSPVGVLKDALGGGTYHAIKDSWPLLLDLAPPVPGNALYWLNTQKHPDIQYVSIVRDAPAAFAPDQIVPAPSQDLNVVPALQGKAKTLVVPAGHGLVPADGLTLDDIAS